MIDALNLYELEKLAKEKLPQFAHGYYASGAWDEVTLLENHKAFERIKTHYRVLVDVSRRDMSTTLFGHGGRQMDTAPATIEALPRCSDAVDCRVPILMDGGVRRGLDVLKAVALGATAVQVGRPVLWGLAFGGQAGVETALGLLRQEFDLSMALQDVQT